MLETVGCTHAIFLLVLMVFAFPLRRLEVNNAPAGGQAQLAAMGYFVRTGGTDMFSLYFTSGNAFYKSTVPTHYRRVRNFNLSVAFQVEG